MEYIEYVERGKTALESEERATWELAELAAGVSREHGSLTRWAEDVGLSRKRASALAQTAAEFVSSTGLSVAAATELLPMPAEQREQFLAEHPKPTLREARAAAEPYRKKRTPKPEPPVETQRRILGEVWDISDKLDSLNDEILMGVSFENIKARDHTIKGLEKIISSAETLASALVEADIEELIGDVA